MRYIMKLKQSQIGSFYIRLVTKSLFFFPAFVLLGMGIILFITINTKLDVIKTYQVNVSKDGSAYVLLLNEELDTQVINKIFIYEKKNKAVYQIVDVGFYPAPMGDTAQSKTKLSFDLSSNADNKPLIEFLDKHIGVPFKADIPIKKISLLERIFTNGGVEN